MITTRTLHPEDTLSHYRIVGPLGAGGMGEVYLAQDQSLERNVALKVLPADLVQNEERVRRFVLEAKSASSLSHPNIVTIYEIGKDAPQSATGSDSSPVHFISMELITGKTLSALIHDEKTDLRTLLGYLAQAAEGLAKAHTAGIVHRDLKPGNIMVSGDGFAKVLDFGLAKLTERRDLDPEATSAPTMVANDATGAGVVLGTAGYMSPEQVQGKVVDHRSDVFSFGCILYEAATRKRPFVADSAVETMHKIIHEKPVPVEEANAKAPAELRRLIRRCMAKSPEQRLQSMKDLAIELREIVDEYDTLSPSGSSSGSTTMAAPVVPKSRVPMVAAGAVAVIAVAAMVWWTAHHNAKTGTYRPATVVPQTNRGDLTNCALSADGRYLAYVARPTASTWSLHVRQVATGSDVEVIPTSDGFIEGTSFTPDGNYLFYQLRRADAPNYRRLMQVASLGGTSAERAFDVDTRVTFSPDGKRIAFWRGAPQIQSSTLIVKEIDSGTERTLATIHDPETFLGAASWSPDGKSIAATLQRPLPKLVSLLVVFDAGSGSRRDLWVSPGFFGDVDWMRDGKGLALAGIVPSEGPRSQIYRVSYPSGERTPLTNDLLDYFGVSVSGGDDPAIATVRTSRLSNLWVADAAGGGARQITRVTNPEFSPFAGASGGGDLVVYAGGQERQLQLWAMPAAGGEPRMLTTGDQYVVNVLGSNGVVVCDRIDVNGVRHIWRVKPADGSVVQLTHGTGEGILDIAPDGRFATYTRTDSARGVWRLDLESGRDTLLAPNSVPAGGISPDGQSVVLNEYLVDAAGMVRSRTYVMPLLGGPRTPGFVLRPSALEPDWAPDSKSVSYMDRDDPAGNVFTEWGGERRQVTRFDSGRVTRFDWAPDGKHLAVARQIDDTENVWIVDANGDHATQITQFSTGVLFGMGWLPDSRRVVVAAGTRGRDAVLIRKFR